MEELAHSFVLRGDWYEICAECGCEKYPTMYSQGDGHSDTVLYRQWGDTKLTDTEPACIEKAKQQK